MLLVDLPGCDELLLCLLLAALQGCEQQVSGPLTPLTWCAAYSHGSTLYCSTI